MIKKMTNDDFLEKGPIACTVRNIQNEAFATHWHDFLELEYILSGSGSYIIDGKKYDIEPGMVFLTSPYNIHMVIARNLHLINISFSVNKCDPSILARLSLTEAAIAHKLCHNDRNFIKTLSLELLAHLTDDSYTTLLLNCILEKLQKSAASESSWQPGFSAVQKARLYIINHFKSPLSQGEVAAYVGLTPSYFSALFKKETGMNFKEYLDQLRLEYAKKLICVSDMTIQQVCTESGFGCYENFLRRFKSHFGVSPGQFKSAAAGYSLHNNR
ncbi:MAG: helix-turn-helix domain-containing protein [Lachnospiraceae bacterium]|nr:helix-turn-helix domain-containing protein [Lachnospiraceae bacterium]